MDIKRVFLIVMDSAGVGAEPDALLADGEDLGAAGRRPGLGHSARLTTAQ